MTTAIAGLNHKMWFKPKKRRRLKKLLSKSGHLLSKQDYGKQAKDKIYSVKNKTPDSCY